MVKSVISKGMPKFWRCSAKRDYTEYRQSHIPHQQRLTQRERFTVGHQMFYAKYEHDVDST
jgi:hypothetical protein